MNYSENINRLMIVLEKYYKERFGFGLCCGEGDSRGLEEAEWERVCDDMKRSFEYPTQDELPENGSILEVIKRQVDPEVAFSGSIIV